jgi:hypothetical protein
VLPVVSGVLVTRLAGVGQAGQTPFPFLLLAPIIGIVLGGIAATIASAGLPRPVLSGARPGPGDDGRRATAPSDA